VYKIGIVDDCPHVPAKESYLFRRLSSLYDIVLVDDPDYLFYSVFGTEHANPKYDRCVKIWFTGENFRPDFSKCDYAMSFDYLDDPRHCRLPLYLHYTGEEGSLIKRPDFNAAAVLRSKDRFCNFVYSNVEAATRLKFFQKLSKYKQVDSAGSVLNNLGFTCDNKQEFLKSYKFTIAFENARQHGYTTEKLVEPMLSNSIPIYWGNMLIGREFNTKSFINCHEFDSFESAIEEIVRLDQDDGRYIAKMKEPWLIGNVDSQYTRNDYLVPFFNRVFATPPHVNPKWANVRPRDFGLSGDRRSVVPTELTERRVFE